MSDLNRWRQALRNDADVDPNVRVTLLVMSSFFRADGTGFMTTEEYGRIVGLTYGAARKRVRAALRSAWLVRTNQPHRGRASEYEVKRPEDRNGVAGGRPNVQKGGFLSTPFPGTKGGTETSQRGYSDAAKGGSSVPPQDFKSSRHAGARSAGAPRGQQVVLAGNSVPADADAWTVEVRCDDTGDGHREITVSPLLGPEDAPKADIESAYADFRTLAESVMADIEPEIGSLASQHGCTDDGEPCRAYMADDADPGLIVRHPDEPQRSDDVFQRVHASCVKHAASPPPDRRT